MNAAPSRFVGGMAVALTAVAWAQPEIEAWPTGLNGQIGAVAASDLSGWYATANCTEDVVEIRDVRGGLMRSISRNDLWLRAPWMNLDASADGPSALAWSDSGRLLFIVVHDDVDPGDGSPGDAVLRYDSALDQLSLFARLNVSDQTSSPQHGAALHHAGRLYVGTDTLGVRVIRAQRNDTFGSEVGSGTLSGQAVRGLAIDRVHGVLFAASPSGFYRGAAGSTPGFVRVGDLTNARGLAYSDHFGPATRHGAYVVSGTGSGARLLFINDLQAQGIGPFVPTEYYSWNVDAHDVCATACGRLLIGLEDRAEVVADATDPWLGFEEWVIDEFEQVVAFGRGLISPPGVPDGWVIDGDAVLGGTRFQSATPDGAAWVVLLLLAHDQLFDDPSAQIDVRRILERYAGLAGDGIAPSRSADGIFRHWIDPLTGGVKPGWDPEFATMSTMKIVLAAARASQYYPDDPRIRRAAQVIMGQVHNWSSYIQPGTQAMYLRGAEGGGPALPAGGPFHEGILFVEQAGAYGGAGSAYSHWLDRSASPSATYVTGMPISTGANDVFQAAFVSMYSQIVQRATRDSPSWRQQARNLLASNAAWTDDNATRFMTVFSAGTTKPAWAAGGYNADSLSAHPGDISTFPSLMAFSANGKTAPAVAGYHAYRHGYRENFSTGASILYRRSNIDTAYTPPDAGLPDVALGALGLVDLIEPGTIDAVLAPAYSSHLPCLANMAEPEGVLDFFDVAAFLEAFAAQDPAADFAPAYGTFDFFDAFTFLGAFSEGCP